MDSTSFLFFFFLSGLYGRDMGGWVYQGFAVGLSEAVEHEDDTRDVVVGGADEGEEAFDGVLPVCRWVGGWVEEEAVPMSYCEQQRGLGR